MLKPILEAENILPKDMSDAMAINWLVQHCYGVKVKEEAAAK